MKTNAPKISIRGTRAVNLARTSGYPLYVQSLSGEWLLCGTDSIRRAEKIVELGEIPWIYGIDTRR